MKKFSKITNQKVSTETKLDKKKESKLDESDSLKYSVLNLMDDLLKVEFYGPINRYQVAGTMKVAGKELFVEALIDLLNKNKGKDSIKLLESLKSKISDWKTIDEKIDEISNNEENLSIQKNKILSIYNRYKGDEDLLVEQINKSINKISSEDVSLLNKACDLLSEKIESNILSKIKESLKQKINESVDENVKVIKDSYNDYIAINDDAQREVMARHIARTAQGFIKNKNSNLEDWLEVFAGEDIVISKLKSL